MDALPDQRTLVDLVLECFSETSGAVSLASLQDDLFGRLKQRLDHVPQRIESAFGRDRRKHEDEREWLFDFFAGIWEGAPVPGARPYERYLKQALVVGEVECHGDLGRDFDKLLCADALVCFFAFPDHLHEHKPVEEIEFFARLAERRVRHALTRRIEPPPAFVILSYKDRKFAPRVVSAETIK